MENSASDTSRNTQDSSSRKIVFRPNEKITFPSSCIGCLVSSPEHQLKLDILVTQQNTRSGGTGSIIGGVVGGAFGGFIGAAAGSVIGGALSGDHSYSTLPLIIPICEICLSKIDKQLKKINDPNAAIVTTQYFTREIEEGFIVFTFNNRDYVDQFRKLNEGLVFSSITEGISQEIRSQAPASVGDKSKSIQEDSQILIDILLPNMPEKNWYRQPTIPPKKLTNATGSYASGITPERIIGLADGSTLGSAKDGCILTSDGIYFKTGSKRGQFSWKGIQKAQPKGGFPNYTLELVLTSGKTADIDCVCFDKIRQELAEFITKMAILNRFDESNIVDKNKSMQENLEILMERLLPNMPDEHWYRQPTIPPKKLTNAIASYASGITPERIIGLADGSTFGSAKDGCILTSDGIYFKSTLGRGQFSWKDIQKAQSKKGNFLELFLTSGKTATIECISFAKISEALAEFITQMAVITHTTE